MGISYGGLVAAEFARRYPEYVHKLILVDAAVKFLGESDIKRVLSEFKSDDLSELFVPEHAAGLNVLFKAATGSSLLVGSKFLKEFHQKRIKQNASERKLVIRNLLDEMNRYQEERYRFSFPVCLIWGENDPLVPVHSAERLAEYLGNKAQLHVIRNAGHMPNIIRTVVFNRIVRGFLDGSHL